MEAQIIVELIRATMSSVYTLAKLADISDEERDKLVADTLEEVRKRNPSDLPDV